MNKLVGIVWALLSASLLPSCAMAQGGFGGGFGGQQGGFQQQIYDRSGQAIQQGIAQYVDSEEIRNILTPGGFSEWRLTLKAGQVVFAEARSDAFDPAIQITDEKEKVLKENDDRYPGDQRPLLMWRCAKDGVYSLRVRSFQGKAGGQFFLKLKMYDCYDLPADGSVQVKREDGGRYLVRIPMKAGEIKQLFYRNENNFSRIGILAKISPIGLPDIDLAQPLQAVFPGSMLAPVDGDYYAMVDVWGGQDRQFTLGVQILHPGDFTVSGANRIGRVPDSQPTLWNLEAKQGDFLKVTAPDLALNSRLIIVEQPDISSYSLDKPETNPFFPQPAEKMAPKGELARVLPGRARDGRVLVFQEMRDAKLWILSDGIGAHNGYTVMVAPGATALETSASGHLRIGSTDYWAFNGNLGDVMTFQTSAPGFAQHTIIRFPGLGEWRNVTAEPDQSADAWNMVISQPGRYLVAMSCMGDGGSGDYNIHRTVFPPRDFAKGSPAQGEFTDTNMQVWRFSVKAGEPLLMRWKSTSWDYSIQAFDTAGNPMSLPLQTVNDGMQVAVLPARESVTYMLVITPRTPGAKYSIELVDLPTGG